MNKFSLLLFLPFLFLIVSCEADEAESFSEEARMKRTCTLFTVDLIQPEEAAKRLNLTGYIEKSGLELNNEDGKESIKRFCSYYL